MTPPIAEPTVYTFLHRLVAEAAYSHSIVPGGFDVTS